MQVDAAADGVQAVDRLKEHGYDLVISDIKMPRITGFQLLAHIKERFPETVVIMITAFSTTEEAVEAMKQGAYDYITKPFKNEEIRLIVKNALERKALREENTELKKELGRRYSFGSLIGKSKSDAGGLRPDPEGRRQPGQRPDHRRKRHRQGTGRQGRFITTASARTSPFVPINCGAIPENLLESELFGHEKGSFTGAIQQKAGLFEVADGGTLFLDEIGELPPMMQVKLLRVLQEREFRRVGGTKNIQVDVRLDRRHQQGSRGRGRRRAISARTSSIASTSSASTLPPLRERREDIPLLVGAFLQEADREGGGRQSPKAPCGGMLDYHWPGNIRELENAIERCVILGKSGEISEDCLPSQLQGRPQGGLGPMNDLPENGLDLDAYLGSIEKDILLKALERTGGVRKKAAEFLGITFRSIRYRLAKFGIDPDEEE